MKGVDRYYSSHYKVLSPYCVVKKVQGVNQTWEGYGGGAIRRGGEERGLFIPQGSKNFTTFCSVRCCVLCIVVFCVLLCSVCCCVLCVAFCALLCSVVVVFCVLLCSVRCVLCIVVFCVLCSVWYLEVSVGLLW